MGWSVVRGFDSYFRRQFCGQFGHRGRIACQPRDAGLKRQAIAGRQGCQPLMP
jgi:hypothetical protein